MGCSSSRPSRERPPAEEVTNLEPATPGQAVKAAPKAGPNSADDLDGDNPDFKKTLILKKNQKSMEGRQNQVWWA